MARYIGRYVKHPPIAESRITAFDGKQVTFWYKDSETKQRITVTMEKFEKRSWREEIKKTFKYDPLICPYCETEMELIGTCYEGKDSYPTQEPQPFEPPPDYE